MASSITNSRIAQIVILSAMGLFVDGYDLFMMSIAMPIIMSDWHLQATSAGLIGAVAPIGAIIGAFSFGYFLDKFGRKKIMILNMGLLSIFTLLTAFSPNVETLVILRFLTGICIGADYPASATYMSEMLPEKTKGRFMLCAFAFISLGALISALFGYFLLKEMPHNYTWHWLLFSSCIPTAIVFVLRFTLPESQLWLHNKYHQAKSMVKKVTFLHQYQELFSKKYRGKLFFAATPWFLLDFSAYSLGFFMPVIFMQVFEQTQHQTLIHESMMAAKSTAFSDIFNLIGIFISFFIIDKFGRFKTQQIGFVGVVIAMVLLTISTFNTSTVAIIFVFAGFMLYNTSANAGPFPTTYIIAAEIFPTEIRGSAQGFSSSMAKLGAAIGTAALPFLSDNLGKSIAMGIMTGLMIVALGITIYYKKHLD